MDLIETGGKVALQGRSLTGHPEQGGDNTSLINNSEKMEKNIAEFNRKSERMKKEINMIDNKAKEVKSELIRYKKEEKNK